MQNGKALGEADKHKIATISAKFYLHHISSLWMHLVHLQIDKSRHHWSTLMKFLKSVVACIHRVSAIFEYTASHEIFVLHFDLYKNADIRHWIFLQDHCIGPSVQIQPHGYLEIAEIFCFAHYPKLWWHDSCDWLILHSCKHARVDPQRQRILQGLRGSSPWERKKQPMQISMQSAECRVSLSARRS